MRRPTEQSKAHEEIRRERKHDVRVVERGGKG